MRRRARIAGARAAPGFGGRMLASVAHAFGKPGAGACVDCHTEHEGAGPMAPTPQAFCTDCHATLKQRLADTKIGNAGDFGTAHPQFRPLVAVTPGADAGHGPGIARSRARRDDERAEIPARAASRPTGGVARMAQTLKARNGFGNALVCADCHTPTADGVRFLPVDMEQNCQMCHSLAFDRIGGTVRTLRHGDTRQMMADLRALYRSTAPARPPQLGGMAASATGRLCPGAGLSRLISAPPRRGPPMARRRSRRYSPRAAPVSIAIPSRRRAPAASTDWTVTPVHQPMRYMMHGWFDHDAHQHRDMRKLPRRAADRRARTICCCPI